MGAMGQRELALFFCLLFAGVYELPGVLVLFGGGVAGSGLSSGGSSVGISSVC